MKEMKVLSNTYKKLIDVAVDLFASNGFNGTSIRDIAKLSDMTISNIYYHFGSKEGLLLTILEQLTKQIVIKLHQVTESDCEPIGRFKLLLKTHLDLLLNIYKKESIVLFLDEEYVSRIIKQFQIDLMNIYRKELQNLHSLGIINYKNLTILAFNIFGIINWHLRWYKPEGKLSFDQISDEMVAFIFHGMLGSTNTGKNHAKKLKKNKK